MGLYRFTIPSCDEFQRDSLLMAQIVGLEGVPWPCKTSIDGELLSLHRNTDSSGRLLVPFQSRRFNEIFLTTGTLPESRDPYVMEIELARGTLSRLRNQVSIWREGGLEISEDFDSRLGRVTERFSQAIFPVDPHQHQQRNHLCCEILQETLDLTFEITDEFSRQVAQIRLEQDQNSPIIAGSIVGPEELKRRAGNAPEAIPEPVQVTVKLTETQSSSSQTDSVEIDVTANDSSLDWIAKKPGQRILGPLIDFSMTDPPWWLGPSSTFDSQLRSASQMCRALGQRYPNVARIVHVAAGINGVGHQHFTYPQQLQLTIEMLETLDQSLSNASVLVSFDQPWGERLSMATGGIQAMEIADSLLRYGARLSALGLEFNLDYWPHGTMLRDPLQWVDLIDRWAQFGLPLATIFAAPTGQASAEELKTRFFQTIRPGASAPHQMTHYLGTLMRMIINRPAVNVVSWHYLTDKTNERFPMSGLLDQTNSPKPIARWFEEFLEFARQVTNPQ